MSATTTILRCANWKADRETCGENCGIKLPPSISPAMVRLHAMNVTGWVYLEYMRNGVRYRLPFCSMHCLMAWNDRMVTEHGAGLDHHHAPSESEVEG